MALTDVIFRVLAKAGFVTKGSRLTWTELDENFENIIDEINLNAAAATGNVNPYNGATAYSNVNPDYVSYSGNIYVCISATPITGVLPDSDPTKWTLVSSGTLTHVQNTDTKIGQGSAYESSAQAIHDIINNQVITATLATFVADAAANRLTPNRLYYLSDAGEYYVRAETTSKYSRKGHMMVTVPKYDSIPLYNFSAGYTAGDRAIADGQVWENTTGSNGVQLPSTDFANWSLESGGAYYDIILHDITFTITSAPAFVVHDILDNAGNVCHLALYMHGNTQYKYGNNASKNSVLKNWNSNGYIAMNKLINSAFENKVNEFLDTGLFTSNVLENAVVNLGTWQPTDVFQGEISGNVFRNVEIEFQEGIDAGAQFMNIHIDYKRGTILYIDKNVVINGGYLNVNGGNIEKAFSYAAFTATHTLTGNNDIYGVYRISATTTIVSLSGVTPKHRVKIVPPVAGTLSVSTVDAATAGADQFLNNAIATLTLTEANGDYIIVEKTLFSGIEVWKLVEVQIAL